MLKMLTSVLTVAALLVGSPAVVWAQDLPAAPAGTAAFAPLEPLVGRTWRGAAVGQDGVEDIARWEWAVGGHAVRVTHSVNGGAYGGETLIFPDRDSGQLIFHYFTSGGFHTTGVMRPAAPGVLEIEETVHGVDAIEMLRSRAVLEDGVYRVRTLVEREGEWVEFGGFDYREDPTARVVLPMMAGRESMANAGPLTISRRIVRGVDEAGQDVAGYLLIRNGSVSEDELTAVTCDCAETIEFHHIRRTPERVSMDADPAWVVPAGGALSVRPGSDLHLMLIGYDPAKAADGRVRMSLTFRDAGTVQTDFTLTQDSAAAWAAFD